MVSAAGDVLAQGHCCRDGESSDYLGTVCSDDSLAGTELVVGVTPDSNNSARKLFSALGSRITFAGAGCGFGEALGFTAGPTVPQLESTAAQVSHNSIRDGLGRLPVFFMLGSNVGQHLGLFVFGGARGLLNL
ncbi:hypothetical protein Xtri_13500 [Xanthomonas campestris pv. trichodesmae]|uniref:Uncharacterized protein n=1 Tax=Xanthomonas citri pv. sesbaniae TaxID=473425 RepID=A0AAW4RLT8_XANCI|nr:hypothetical protein [Xanthomonas campestris pv. trichodesmae]MBZ3923808.1 hypothetical protein [Xanthomonas citri pv. sesbaniae]